MTTNNESLYTPGMTMETLYDKLKTLTAETAETHGVHDLRHPAWGLGLIYGGGIKETENQIAQLLITMPPGETPKNGDTLLIPTADPGKPQVAMIFDVASHSGDWGTGDPFMVHAIQYRQDIGHAYAPKPAVTEPAPAPAPIVQAKGAVNHPPAPPQTEIK